MRVPTEEVKLVTPTEKACASEATEFMRARYTALEVDARGIPTDFERYTQWALVADGCMRAR
jgi:hypothetical protein